jgi:hypothetical protein
VRAPELWDGHTAERIVKVLLEKFRPDLFKSTSAETSRR